MTSTLSLKRKGVHGKKPFKFGDKVMYRHFRGIFLYERPEIKGYSFFKEHGYLQGIILVEVNGMAYQDTVLIKDLKRGWKHG